MTTPEILRQDAYDVTVAISAPDLIAMMKAVNAEQQDPEAGIVWWLYAGNSPAGRLVAGVRGERGVLTWSGPEQQYLPDSGLNEDDVDYFTWEGHHFTQRPGSEMPIDLVYRAVAEYVATHRRPTCVGWGSSLDPENKNV